VSVATTTDDDDLTDEDLHDDEEAGLTGRERRRKQRKRRRNQRLDQRVAGDVISPEEKREADRNVIKRLVVNVVLIGLWYFFSLLISLVCLLKNPRPIDHDHMLTFTAVQQMDVLTRQAQLPLSYVHHRVSFPRSVFPGLVGFIPLSVSAAQTWPAPSPPSSPSSPFR
jgi:hypothetical protein